MTSALTAILRSCALCPRRCGVDRTAGEVGFCGIGAKPVIASYSPHFGEEPCLVGSGGSGTIFFTGCNLGCVFCQNHEISHLRAGYPLDADRLARIMLQLQRRGCHNINWVTPTHQTPAIIAALAIARANGLTVPTVYNCGGYESVEVLRMIQGHVAIYMPDAKFLDPDHAERYCLAKDYPEVMRAALKEMHRQVGDLQIQDGIAVRGLLVRHLVMPGGVEESKAILDFLATEISPRTFVNVMDQYRPCYRANEFPALARRTTPAEHMAVRQHAEKLGLRVCD